MLIIPWFECIHIYSCREGGDAMMSFMIWTSSLMMILIFAWKEASFSKFCFSNSTLFDATFFTISLTFSRCTNIGLFLSPLVQLHFTEDLGIIISYLNKINIFFTLVLILNSWIYIHRYEHILLKKICIQFKNIIVKRKTSSFILKTLDITEALSNMHHKSLSKFISYQKMRLRSPL